MQCNLCDNKNFKTLYPNTIDSGYLKKYVITDNSIGKHGKMAKCVNCGLVFIIDFPFNKEELKSIYVQQPVDEVYLSEEINRRVTAKKILTRIDKITGGRKGRLIDLGCSSGSFIKEAKDKGWEVYGVDLAMWAKREAKTNYGLEIITGDIVESLSNFPDSYFDVVVAFDIIEHMITPTQFIKNVYNKLASGGILVLITPNINSIMAKIFREKWYAVVPSHLYYFSPKTITKLLEKNNFTIIKTKTHTRYFSLWYLGRRLGGFNNFILNRLSVLFCTERFKTCKIPVNFGDQLEVYSKK